MSPFTADAKIIERIFAADNEFWKFLSGPIASIEFLQRSTHKISEGTNEQIFILKITTFKPDTTIVDDVKEFEVRANWSFMDLQRVEIKKM